MTSNLPLIEMEQIMLVILFAIARMMGIVDGAIDEVCLRAKPMGVSRDYWDCETPS